MRVELERLRLGLRAGGLGVWQWDRASGAAVWDAALEALFGLAPGAFAGTMEAWAELVHPDDRAAVMATVGAATEAGDDYLVEHRVVWPDGSERWLHCTAQPLVVGGEVTGYIGVTSDVTARRRVEEERTALLAGESAARAAAEAATERLALLARASATLGDTLDLDERLRRLGAVGVPHIADCAAVYVREGEHVRLVAVSHTDAEGERILRDLAGSWPIRLDAPTGVGAAIRNGVTSRIEHLDEGELGAMATSDAQRAALRSLRVTGGLVLPIRGRGDPVGAVTFLATGSRQLDDAGMALAAELVGRAGVLIENAVLFEARERDRAEQRYQAALLGALYRASLDGILVVDPGGRVLSRNDRFAEVWGFDAARAATEDDDALLEQAMDKVADPASFIARVRTLYADPPATAQDEIHLADGRVLDRHGIPLHTDEGAYLGWAWTFRDVTVDRAQQAAIARAGERSAALARTLQESLLPPRLPSIAGVDLAARYHPALEGVEVGGDFYDVFAVDDEWCMVLGDVCGKGPEAARITGLARWTLRAAAIRNRDPAAILDDLNAVMRSDVAGDELEPRFATVCCVLATAHRGGGVTVRIASAGHPAPLVLRAAGTVNALALTGTPVGLFDEIELTSTTIELAAGDGLVLLTDGVLEARDRGGSQLEVAGVTEVVQAAAGGSAAALSRAIEARALAHQGGVAHDDIAILVAIAGQSRAR